MKKLLLSTMALLTAAISMSSQAIEVTIDNTTNATVVFAFSYLNDQKDKSLDPDWFVEGWYNVNPHQKALVNLPSDNDVYYLYAEFSNGKKLEGGKGSIKLMVNDRSFSYKQKEVPKKLTRQATFLRARCNQGKSLIKIN